MKMKKRSHRYNIEKEKVKQLWVWAEKSVYVTLKSLDVTFKITKFAISFNGPRLWNKMYDKHTKAIKSSSFFQRTIKKKFINLENAIEFF